MRKNTPEPIFSAEAEKSVLGCLLINSVPLTKISERIRPEDFYQENHSLILQAMMDLEEAGSPIDTVSVTMQLKTKNLLEKIGGVDYLASLGEIVGFSTNLEYYVQVVQDKSTVRRLQMAVAEIYRACSNNGSSPIELVTKAKEAIQALAESCALGRGKITDKVREWCMVAPGDFSVTFCYAELGYLTPKEKAAARKALERLVKEGTLINVPGKKGWYRLVVKEMERIKLTGADKETGELDIKWPFQLEYWYKTLPKSIAIIAGEPDSGKTAWCLDFIHKNLGRTAMPIHYFTSEMGEYEFYDRASQIPGFSSQLWDEGVSIWERSEQFEDVIFPDGINVIDYLELRDEFWKVSDMIFKIWSKLKGGICLIALQKDPLKTWGKGGVGSAEKARLYATLKPGNPQKQEPNVMKIDKIKNWRNRLVNIKGREFPFRLVNGCTFKEVIADEGKKDWRNEY